MCTDSQLWIIARVLVSLALLALAGTLFVISPLDGDHPFAVSLIGVVAGYWLGHAEVTVTSRGKTE